MKKNYLNFFMAALLSVSALSCKKQNAVTNEVVDADRSAKMHTFNFDGNNIQIKEENGVYYLADDITLSKEQFNFIKVNSNKNVSTSERALVINALAKRWPGGIVYYDLSGLGADTAAALKAMEYISRVSPVTFVQRTTQANYINFVKSTVNTSPIGMIGGAQTVNLVNYNTIGIIIHEIFHSLGANHEMCRPDRDDYIIVNYDNIDPSGAYNYNKVSATSYTTIGTPLDIESILMYAADPIGSPQKITKLDGSRYETCFPSPNMSPADIAGINHMYTGFTYVGLPANTNYEISTALDITKVLNVSGNYTADGTQVILWTDVNTSNGRWNVTKNASGYYILSPLNAPGKVLTVVAGGIANGTKLEIRTNTSTTSQQFNIIPVEGGYYIISPRNVPSKNIDIPGSATANGTLPGLWGYGGANNQKFKFSTF
ncbi:hypothetical protein CA265_11870 [Sphingobacteriaceae bacterium GW460-11-11-14-LB5]|nr:hypothetical protein CA265_11870 [Sphingobacteriaceae bacterium GW460-11-11-14-LB5]